MNCIEFPFGGYHFYDKYHEYINSHKWKTIHTKGNGIMEQCEDCKCVMQNASGTINFRFGCSILEA